MASSSNNSDFTLVPRRGVRSSPRLNKTNQSNVQHPAKKCAMKHPGNLKSPTGEPYVTRLDKVAASSTGSKKRKRARIKNEVSSMSSNAFYVFQSSFFICVLLVILKFQNAEAITEMLIYVL